MPPTPGTLYIVPTPIGNLEDITLRALKILGEVDFIACEDTRHTRKLLTHFNISKPLVSYHSYSEDARSLQLLNDLKQGASIALVTDAGTPGISDPGFILISRAIEEKIPVVSLPGPCALIVALAGSGLPTDRFYFHGFLPLKPGKRRKYLEQLSSIEATLIFYESGRRLFRLFSDLAEIFPQQPVVLARELTKMHETFYRGTADSILNQIPRDGLKGECVILVDGRK